MRMKAVSVIHYLDPFSVVCLSFEIARKCFATRFFSLSSTMHNICYKCWENGCLLQYSAEGYWVCCLFAECVH